jgi:hypothetical protein
MSYTSDKAAGRNAADPFNVILNPPAPKGGSNQTRFTRPSPDKHATPNYGNQEQSAPPKSGLDRDDIESAMALAPKRRNAIKMPANY